MTTNLQAGKINFVGIPVFLHYCAAGTTAMHECKLSNKNVNCDGLEVLYQT
jgi:hypothetical protein